MKKFISMVMAAAMVVSLVPATAFAASGSAVFKCVDAIEVKEDDAEAKALKNGINGPQGQIVLTDVNGKAGYNDTFEIDIELDNAEVSANFKAGSVWWGADVVRTQQDVKGSSVLGCDLGVGVTAEKPYIYMKDDVEKEDTSFTIVIKENNIDFKAGDVIILPIELGIIRATDINEGTVITATVSGDFGESEPLVIASVLSEGLDVTVAGKPVEVAEEEIAPLKKITVETTVGKFTKDDEVKVKVSKGFEITETGSVDNGKIIEVEDEYIKVGNLTGKTSFTITGMEVEAVSAEAGDICTITVSCKGYEGDSDEAAEVIADAVIMSVDEDEDVPVMYNGVNTDEDGLTSEESHKSLEVTIEESVVDAWDTVDKWNLDLPEGVYVTGMNVTGLKGIKEYKGDITTFAGMFEKAYQDGKYEEFDFSRRAFVAAENQKVEMSFTFDLVAEPTFVGNVVLTLSGDGVGEAQEVVIAEFVAPYTVEAAQNDLVIDYKETVVPTAVVITEAEAGLWAGEKDTHPADFQLFVEKIEVEDADITVNEESEMEIDVDGEFFAVEEESDEEAAVVTMDNVALYMQRNIPAGAYDLKLHTSMYDGFLNQNIFGQDAKEGIYKVGDVLDAAYTTTANGTFSAFCDTVTVKEGFVNVITAGRDKDDASFTKTVVVPVGAMEIVAGEEVVALDVPAYINAAGYTMLPVRAVAVALGIHTNNVIWDQATKTVTILYGQRIITMQVGSKVINVNGSAIPASAAVEIVNGRTFLGLRDLATALGVTDITWDAATQTATLNGNK